jgi:hypothetical protein
MDMASYFLGRQNNNSALSEEFVHEQLAEFKEREVDYKVIYVYDTADLANRNIWYNEKGFAYSSFIDSGENSDGKYYYLNIRLRIIMAKKLDQNQPMKYIVDTPLEFDVSVRDDGYLNWKILNKNIIDAGFIIEGEKIFFNEFFENLEEEIYFQKALEFASASQSLNSGSGIGGLDINVLFSSYYEEAITGLKEEFDALIEAYGDKVFIVYKNEPEAEIIEAEFRG